MNTRPGITHEEHAAAFRRRAEIQAARDAVVEAAKRWAVSGDWFSPTSESVEAVGLALDALEKLEAGNV